MSTLKTGKVKTTTIADELDTESTAVTNVINGSAKAWVNFNGTGTVAIRRGFNVSSITDVSSSKYRVNFATAMPDANYSTTSMGDVGSGANVQINSGETPPATSFIELRTYNLSWAGVDSSYVFIAVFS